MIPQRDKSLENNMQKRYELFKPYTVTTNSSYDVHDEGKKLDREEPEFKDVPSSHMPSGVRGWYDSITVSGQVINDTFARTVIYVKAHEYGHHQNKPHPDSPRQHEEDMADAYAAARTGYVLRPFGISEDYFRVHYDLNKVISGTKTLSSQNTYSLQK